MNGSAHGTKYMVGKNFRFGRSFREDSGVCLSDLKNRDVTGIAHDV